MSVFWDGSAVSRHHCMTIRDHVVLVGAAALLDFITGGNLNKQQTASHMRQSKNKKRVTGRE